jgi:hypothetical protein
MAAASPGGTTSALFWSSTIRAFSPTSVTTIGRLAAIASSRAIGMASHSEAMT